MAARSRFLPLAILLACSLVTAFISSAPTGAATPAKSRATIQLDGNAIDLDVVLVNCRERFIDKPVIVRVVHPVGLSASEIASDTGFNGKGYDIRFTSSAGQHDIASVAVTVSSRRGSCQTEISYTFRDPMAGGAMAAPGRNHRPVTFDIYV